MDLDFDKLPRFKSHSVQVFGLIPQWAYAHQVPDEAIINQLYIAHAWCDSNPKKAPKKQVSRFLWSWMAQAKRYGNLKVPQKNVPRAPEVIPEEDMTFEEMRAIREANMKRKVTDAEVVDDVA